MTDELKKRAILPTTKMDPEQAAKDQVVNVLENQKTDPLINNLQNEWVRTKERTCGCW